MLRRHASVAFDDLRLCVHLTSYAASSLVLP
jgi:hypothetical protein